MRTLHRTKDLRFVSNGTQNLTLRISGTQQNSGIELCAMIDIETTTFLSLPAAMVRLKRLQKRIIMILF